MHKVFYISLFFLCGCGNELKTERNRFYKHGDLCFMETNRFMMDPVRVYVPCNKIDPRTRIRELKNVD